MNKQKGFFASSAFIVVMSCVSALVIAALCTAAVNREQRAKELSRAVVMATTASDCFYAESDKAAMAKAMGGSLQGDEVVLEQDGLTLKVKLGEENGMLRADIAVYSEKQKQVIYAAACLKATEVAG